MDIAKLFDLTVKTSFVYKGEEIRLEVFTEKVTLDFQDRLKEANEKSETEAVRLLIQECVKSWSLDWDQKPFPPTAENISKCPTPFLAACVNAVLGIWQADSAAAPVQS